MPDTAADTPLIGIIMGSQSDWDTMREAADVLTALGVPHETRIVSAHRTPDRLFEYAKSAKGRGLKAIIAGAGGAAHLPGMAAAMTPRLRERLYSDGFSRAQCRFRGPAQRAVFRR